MSATNYLLLRLGICLMNLVTYGRLLGDDVKIEIISNKGIYKSNHNENIPVVIFIPGIFGSKLTTTSGKVIWGSITEYGDLTYRSNDVIKTDILRNVLMYDVYGAFLDRLDSLSFDDNYLHFEFSYDWRKDIREIAKDFSEWLKKKVLPFSKERSFIIVAHSMGGEVLKWWYGFEKEGITNLPAIKKVIFVGTPHKGTPSVIQAALDGWSSLNGIFKIDKILPQIMMLNQALPSFPSCFQLLPLKETESVQRTTNLGSVEILDPYSIQVWKRFGWLRKLVDRTEAKESNIRFLLNEAKLFRDKIKDIEIPNATYYYGNLNKNDTAFRYSCDDKKESCQLLLNVGDGTVPQEIAKNFTKGSDPENYRLVEGEHMQLLIHPTFIAHLTDLINTSKQEYSQNILNNLFRNNKQEIGMLKSSLFPVSSWPQSEAKAMALKHNQDVLKKIGFESKLLTESQLVTQDQETWAIESLYASNPTAYRNALRFVVKVNVKKKLNWRAIDNCQTVMHNSSFESDSKKAKADVLKDCGIAYLQAGYYNIALLFWQKSNHIDPSIGAGELSKKVPVNSNDSIKWNPFESAAWFE